MGLTLGLTFMIFPVRCLHRAGRRPEVLLLDRSAVAVDDPAARQVVGAELHDHAVLGDDADVVLPHLSGDRCQNLVSVGELNAEHRVGQRLGYDALDLDDTVFLSHSLADASADRSICGGWMNVGLAGRTRRNRAQGTNAPSYPTPERQATWSDRVLSADELLDLRGVARLQVDPLAVDLDSRRPTDVVLVRLELDEVVELFVFDARSRRAGAGFLGDRGQLVVTQSRSVLGRLTLEEKVEVVEERVRSFFGDAVGGGCRARGVGGVLREPVEDRDGVEVERDVVVSGSRLQPRSVL